MKLGMRSACAWLLLGLNFPGAALASNCARDSGPHGDVDAVVAAAFAGAMEDQEARILWGMAGADEEQGGWLSFAWQGLSNLKFSGAWDRYNEVERVSAAVKRGARAASLGIPQENYRLRNVAELTEVIVAAGDQADAIAAHSLRDANAWFYTLFGNNAGSFENMDIARYREIAAMPAEQAAKALGEFEAKTFRASGDADTIAFGNSLPAEQRRDLFLLHSQYAQ
jgi:hypothetical protein